MHASTRVTAEHGSLAAGTEQAKEDFDTLAVRICELKASVATRNRDLDVLVRTVGSLKGGGAASRDSASTKES